jgi:hypothetical protein
VGQQPDIDERWLIEYFEFGWADLVAYLTKWAKFLQLYPDPEEVVSDDTQ